MNPIISTNLSTVHFLPSCSPISFFIEYLEYLRLIFCLLFNFRVSLSCFNIFSFFMSNSLTNCFSLMENMKKLKILFALIRVFLDLWIDSVSFDSIAQYDCGDFKIFMISLNIPTLYLHLQVLGKWKSCDYGNVRKKVGEFQEHV